jgi:hypothetical protein
MFAAPLLLKSETSQIKGYRRGIEKSVTENTAAPDLNTRI